MKEEKIKSDSRYEVGHWVYKISWLMKEHFKENILSEETHREVSTLVQAISKELAIEIIEVSIEQAEIDIEFVTKTSINLGKTSRILQKAVKKVMDYEVWKTVLITNGQQAEDQDMRQKKIVETLQDVMYYDLEEGMDDNEINRLKQSLSHQSLSIIEEDETIFLVDIEALTAAINLNCFECTKKHQYGCCCGAPCHFSDKNSELFSRYEVAMEELVKQIDEKQYERLKVSGGFMTANGNLREIDGHCSLLVQEEGCYKCLPHKYALEHTIPIYELCPLSCLMYPLEILELIGSKKKKVYLLTSVVKSESAEQFGRWGSYASLDVELRCIRKEAHNEMFLEKDYKPVYEVNKGLLIHEFSEAFYKGIVYLAEHSRNKNSRNTPK